MKVLVIGSGGREHTLVWKIAQSRKVKKIFCAPGNGGTAELAENVNIRANDIKRLATFAERENIDLTVVGPEAPLVNGIVDLFEERGLKIFGPRKDAAILEGSKIYSKEFMQRYGIPTAQGKTFTSSKEAREYIDKHGLPLVIKADGLCAGKGVLVANSPEEAKGFIDLLLEDKIFGHSGCHIIIEEFFEGEEASILVLTDGKHVIPLASSQDHKRIGDGDTGLNTGGMGAYSPAPVITDKLMDSIIEEVIEPSIKSLAQEGVKYQGVLYAGLIITTDGPKVLEFNVRFGDPEVQAIIPRLKSDIVDIMLATIDGTLDKVKLDWDDKACVSVVLASKGYPGTYKTGKEISGLDEIRQMDDIVVFHAGTIKQHESILTNGGRVLNVTGLGNGIEDAIKRTYEAVRKISFEGAQYRKDIGFKALKAEKV